LIVVFKSLDLLMANRLGELEDSFLMALELELISFPFESFSFLLK